MKTKNLILLSLSTLAITATTVLFSCKKENQTPIPPTDTPVNTATRLGITDDQEAIDYFKKNIAIVFGRETGLVGNQMKYEILFKNFGDTPMPKEITINGYFFNDNGTGADATANDGIYTAIVVNKDNTQLAIGELKYTVSTAVVNDQFEHDDALVKYLGDNGYDPTFIELDCPIHMGFNPWTHHWGYSIDWDKCHVIIGW